MNVVILGVLATGFVSSASVTDDSIINSLKMCQPAGCISTRQWLTSLLGKVTPVWGNMCTRNIEVTEKNVAVSLMKLLDVFFIETCFSQAKQLK